MIPLTLNEILRTTRGRPLSPVRSCSITALATDSRQVQTGDLFVAIHGERFDGHDFVEQALQGGALYAMVSDARRFADREVAGQIIHVPNTRQALGQIAAFHRKQLSASVIAVTGSNGKTTTKAMINHVLGGTKPGRCSPKSFNNDIGVPLTLLSAEAADEFLVVEVGTNAPGEIKHLGAMVSPDIAVVTSVDPAHLEGLSSLDGVADEKLSLLSTLLNRGLAVVNINRPEVRRRLPEDPSFNLVTFGTEHNADIRFTDLQQDGHCIRFKINGRFEARLSGLGLHNATNALAAFAVGRRFGLEAEEILARLVDFQLPEMRMQMRQFGSMMIINDSYNANPGSMRGAIEALAAMKTPGRRVAILGDMLELGEQAATYHSELGRLVAGTAVDVLLGVGQFSDVVCDSARKARHRRFEVHASKNVDELTDLLATWLKPKDTILLKGSRALQLERILEYLPNN